GNLPTVSLAFILFANSLTWDVGFTVERLQSFNEHATRRQTRNRLRCRQQTLHRLGHRASLAQGGRQTRLHLPGRAAQGERRGTCWRVRQGDTADGVRCYERRSHCPCVRRSRQEIRSIASTAALGRLRAEGGAGRR